MTGYETATPARVRQNQPAANPVPVPRYRDRRWIRVPDRGPTSPPRPPATRRTTCTGPATAVGRHGAGRAARWPRRRAETTTPAESGRPQPLRRARPPAATAPEPTDPSTEPPTRRPAPPSPSVSPASGIQLNEASSTVTAPAGWEAACPRSWSTPPRPGKPGGLASLQLVDSGDISGGASLDSLAQSTLDTLPQGAKATGCPTSTWTARLSSTSTTRSGASRASTTRSPPSATGRNVGLDFVLLKKDSATNPDLIASVLATFPWIA